jgi:glycogen debranching enzyme
VIPIRNSRAALRARVAAAALDRHRASLREGYDPFYGRRFKYAQPSPGRYRWMWFWDACFHIIALSRLDPRLAHQELECLLATQDPDGFVGHIVYWGRCGAFYSAVFGQSRPSAWRRRHSHLIQPPFLAQAVERLFVASRDATLLRSVLPAIGAYYDWLARVRLGASTGMLAIVTPFESGMDNSPAFDAPMGVRNPGRVGLLVRLRLLDLRNTALLGRKGAPEIPSRPPFLVYDLLVNWAYADGLRALARLHEATGDSRAFAAANARAAAVESAVNEHCWDAARGLYFHLDGRTGRRLEVSTLPSLLPALFPTTPDDRRAVVVERHLRSPSEYWLDFPLPSVARSCPEFDPASESMIWRGPTAMNLNWSVVRALRAAGLNAEADHVADRSLEMADLSGFREFYDPLTGAGLRGTRFGWATAVVDLER